MNITSYLGMYIVNAFMFGLFLTVYTSDMITMYRNYKQSKSHLDKKIKEQSWQMK